MSINIMSFAFGMLVMVATIFGVVIVAGIVKVGRLSRNLAGVANARETDSNNIYAIIESTKKEVEGMVNELSRDTTNNINKLDDDTVRNFDGVYAEMEKIKTELNHRIADVKSSGQAYTDKRVDTVRNHVQGIVVPRSEQVIPCDGADRR